MQVAYPNLVASSEAKLKSDRGDLWDSGRVASSQSVLVSYAGKPLASHAQCFWKVRVWTDEKSVRIGAGSRSGRWEFSRRTGGNAKWIGLDGDDTTNILSGTSWIWFPEGNPAEGRPSRRIGFAKKSLPADRKIKRAVFQYTGDDECRGWLGNLISARGTISRR